MKDSINRAFTHNLLQEINRSMKIHPLFAVVIIFVVAIALCIVHDVTGQQQHVTRTTENNHRQLKHDRHDDKDQAHANTNSSRLLPDFSPPDFFILGATKCGTTSLHELLLTHPEMCDAGAKELHYFDRPAEYAQGSAYYMRHFHHTDGCRRKGEKGHYIDGTPNYLDHLEAPARMAETFSPAELRRKKFIVVLRDPVYRSYSWYNHQVKHCVAHMNRFMSTATNSRVMAKGGEKGTKGRGEWDIAALCGDVHCDALQCNTKAKHATVGHEVDSLATFAEYYAAGELDVSLGYFALQLQQWLKYVSRSQMFILNLSTLLGNTTSTLAAMTQFLGLRSSFPAGTAFPHDNTATVVTEFPCDIRTELYAQLDPHTAELMHFMAQGAEEDEMSGVEEKDRRPPMEPHFPPFLEYRC